MHGRASDEVMVRPKLGMLAVFSLARLHHPWTRYLGSMSELVTSQLAY